MPDDIKRVQVDITSTYDGRGAAAAAADQEKLFGMQGKAKFDPNLPLFTSKVAAAQQELTNTGRGLATSLPDLSAATQQYVIQTEAEYIAVQKAHEALSLKIPLLQAAGKETKDYESAIRNLDAALSTDAAITIAEKIEQKTTAAAKAEAAFSQNLGKTLNMSAAADAAQVQSSKQAEAAFNQRLGSLLNEGVILDDLAVKEAAYQKAVAELSEAQKVNTGSTTMNSTSLRETLTIIRELEAGRMTRVPGSLSILLQQVSNLGGVLQAGLIAGSAAAFVLFDVVRNIHTEWVKIGEEITKAAEKAAVPEFLQSIEKQREAVADAAADMQGFADALAAAAEKEGDLNSQLQQELGLLQAIERARAALTGAQKELAIARIQSEENSGQITPEQAAEARAAIEKQAIAQEQQDRERSQNEELNARQVALRAAQEKQPTLNAQYQAAYEKSQAEKSHDLEVTNAGKLTLKDLHQQLVALQEKIDAQLKLLNGEGSGMFGGMTVEEFGEALSHGPPADKETIDREKAQMGRLEDQYQAILKLSTPDYKRREKADEDAAANADQKAKDNSQLVDQLRKEVSDLKSEITKVRPIEEQTAATKSATVDQQENARAAQQWQQDARTISEYDRSKNPSPELISRAATAMKDMQEMLIQFKPILDSIANFQGELNDLKTAVARAQNAANNHF